VQELVDRTREVGVTDLFVLRYGRHFTLPGGRRLAVGRNERENGVLAAIGWGNVKIDATGVPGPFSVMDWDGRIASMRRALRIVSRYCDAAPGRTRIPVRLSCGAERRVLSIPAKEPSR
jgi:hypothetical protein